MTKNKAKLDKIFLPVKPKQKCYELPKVKKHGKLNDVIL